MQRYGYNRFCNLGSFYPIQWKIRYKMTEKFSAIAFAETSRDKKCRRGSPRHYRRYNMAEKRTVTMEKLVSLCKNRGFIFPGSEIYGGLANTWDYGPLGVELKITSKRRGGKNSYRKIPIIRA